jgi:hypothetical protein
MTVPLARLSDPNSPEFSVFEIQSMISLSLYGEMRQRFGLVGGYDENSLQLAKVLWRYQGAARRAKEPAIAPQTKELEQLRKAADRALAAFERINVDTAEEIDNAILYRDPFNRKFLFPEQLDYWKKNEKSFEHTKSKLEQISHAVKAVQAQREVDKVPWKQTRNTPLNHLIQDLSIDFEGNTERKAHMACYYSDEVDGYAGQYFDFVVYILKLFARESLYTDDAIGKRIVRILKNIYRKDS